MLSLLGHTSSITKELPKYSRADYVPSVNSMGYPLLWHHFQMLPD